eukprot:gene2311-4503_t
MAFEEKQISVPVLQMNDGFDIPQLGLIAFRTDSKDDTKDYVFEKVEEGIRHLEITELFGNGHEIVESAMRGKNIPREQCYFTLKVWPKNRKPKDIISACKDTLKYIGLEYVDLLLLHAPIDAKNRTEQWRGMETLKNEGLAKSIGVSGMSISHLSNLLKSCLVPPAVLEIEVTPFGQQAELVDYCADNSIVVLCNEPLAKGIKSKNPDLLAVAEALELSTEELLIRWALTKGYGVLLPPSNKFINNDTEGLLEKLPMESMRVLELLEEGLKSSWDINDRDASDDVY